MTYTKIKFEIKRKPPPPALEPLECLGEEHWVQGRMMLGHYKASTSDIYALPDPSHLGRALAVTEQIIDEIEALAPGAYRAVTALGDNIYSIGVAKNG